METIEYRTIDKTGWGQGPWQDEPDKKQWQDNDTGLACLIVRGPVGGLCGYVGVSEGHPWFGRDYSEALTEGGDDWGSDSPEGRTEVHGGLTFSGRCADHSQEQWEKFIAAKEANEKQAATYPEGDSAEWLRKWAGCFDNYEAWVARSHQTVICHIPALGDPDNVWWFGFDCAHAGDLCPKMTRYGRHPDDDRYRDIGYVEAECAKLAMQLASVSSSSRS